MKIILQISRPWVHGTLQVSWVGEVLTRVHVLSDALTVNTVPVLVAGVLVCEGDVWRAESFKVNRVSSKPKGNRGTRRGVPRGQGMWGTSRRNEERTREVVLDIVSKWAGGRVREIQPPMYAPETREDGALLVELLGA